MNRKNQSNNELLNKRVINKSEFKLIFILSFIAFIVRCYRLGSPPSVVFDEVHFGGQVTKYLKQRFFMDVHPPLAKLLLTLAAYLSGFDGNFDFQQIGNDYLSQGVPYITMRSIPALMGVAVVPMTYIICRLLHFKPSTAILGSLLVTFDNALAIQSRFILLDSPLVFFTSLSTLSWLKFSNENSIRSNHFSISWWKWLIITGVSLGAVLSTKWVGLFTIATIGFATITQLWALLGDLQIPPRIFIKHFCARALCLIFIPIVFYLWMFSIHFSILRRSGGGDTFMSAQFQRSLHGNGIHDTYANVGMGSEVSIRHLHSTGGYLHSHPHDYPTGSFQQQITLYPYADDNNFWQIVERSENNNEPDLHDYDNERFRPLYNGAIIRLMHATTGKRLHSHDHKPPVSEADFQNEVSGYGFEGFNGDANDNFKIEMLDDNMNREKSKKKSVQAIKSKFRLKHVLSGCYLFSHQEKLPEWGYGQQEVTCNKQSTLDNSVWFIEVNNHAQLEDDENAEMINYEKPTFFEKFIELQKVMWNVNAGLLERHSYDSRPWTWPILRRGINFWVKDNKQVYLIGNPFVWWLSTLSIGAFSSWIGLLILRNKRCYDDFNNSSNIYYTEVGTFLLAGWILHYIPFWMMDRQLFIHHYLPALLYGILMIAGVFDYVTSALRPKIRLQIALIISLITILIYIHFSSLTYALEWTKEECNKAKWLSSWDFMCNEFPRSYEGYQSSLANDSSQLFSVKPEHNIRDPKASL